MVNTLYIDSNEPQEIKTIVETTIHDRDTEANTEIKGLKTADFIYQDTAIERKEASDLAQSIKDGRLKEQTIRILEDFDHGYVIIEGNPFTLEYSDLHPHAFIGTMVSLSHDGIGVIHTDTKKQTAYALNKIIEKHESGETRTVEELKRTKADTEDLQVAMLSCIQGVSKEKAEKISDKIGSFEDVAQITAAGKGDAVVEKLQEIDGIGSKLAGRVVESITEA